LSDEENLEKIRKKKLEELQKRAIQQQYAEQQQQDYENKKYLIMRKILSPEGRQRLENIRMVKPQFAEQIELQLIQLYQAGRLSGATPLPDKAFKKLLAQISSMSKKKDYKIKK
jgi:programmed cell death protein 5